MGGIATAFAEDSAWSESRLRGSRRGGRLLVLCPEALRAPTLLESGDGREGLLPIFIDSDIRDDFGHSLGDI